MAKDLIAENIILLLIRFGCSPFLPVYYIFYYTTGGYLVLHSSDDHVYGYRTDYRTFENLKTDGTFIYSDDLGSKEGVATIGFTQDGLVITDVLSATGQAYTMDNFMISGKKATQEEYNAEKENQDLKNNVEWHEYPIS